MNYKAKIIKIAEVTVKLLIVLLGFFIIYKKLFVNQKITDVFHEVINCFSTNRQYFLMLLAFLLVPLNLFMESIKWKLQLKPIENLNNWKSFISIFTGISAGMFFPNRMGNFLGRIFILEKGDRIKASLTTIVGGMAQMIATVSSGLIAYLFFIEKHIILNSLCVCIIIFVMSLIYFNIHILRHVMFFFPKRIIIKTEEYFETFASYSKNELLKILLISFARYFLYTFQFVLLIWSFNIPLTYFDAMIPIAFTYLLMMVIPFITITEIAIRGSVSIMVFEKWFIMNNINTSMGMTVFTASSLLWIFNIAIPAVIGLFLTYHLNFFRNKNEL